MRYFIIITGMKESIQILWNLFRPEAVNSTRCQIPNQKNKPGETGSPHPTKLVNPFTR